MPQLPALEWRRKLTCSLTLRGRVWLLTHVGAKCAFRHVNLGRNVVTQKSHFALRPYTQAYVMPAQPASVQATAPTFRRNNSVTFNRPSPGNPTPTSVPALASGPNNDVMLSVDRQDAEVASDPGPLGGVSTGAPPQALSDTLNSPTVRDGVSPAGMQDNRQQQKLSEQRPPSTPPAQQQHQHQSASGFLSYLSAINPFASSRSPSSKPSQ